MRRFGIGLRLGTAGLLAGLVLAAGITLRNSHGDASQPISILKPGEPYAVAVQSDRADFDINFDPTSRYVVVLGSLGAAERRFEIDCAARPVSTSSAGSVNRVRLASPTTVNSGSQPVPKGVVASKARAAGGVSAKAATAPRPRSFALHVTDGSLDDPAQYATIHAQPIAEGRQVRIYLDPQQAQHDLAPALVRNIVELFDNDVIPGFNRLLGTYRDVDHDGHFTVLLSPWLGRLQGGRTSVGGFVRGSDFQSRLGLPFSNQCDMMYVNSQTIPGPHLRTLLIHEYTHAVCFSRRTADAFGPPRCPEEEDWLNEAIAHCAESLLQGGWSNLDYRIARFLNDSAAYPLVVGDYYRAGLWRCHGCRGATYLFLRYCLDRFGSETLNCIISNPARGKRNIELATGEPFDRLFRQWTLSLVSAAARAPLATPSNVTASTTAKPTLAPLDLYGNLGEWGLAGPRRQLWNVDAGAAHCVIAGTSAAYLELFASGAAGPRRLTVKGPADSELQISVVRIEDDAPRIEVLTARLEPSVNRPSAASQQADIPLRTVVRCAGSEDLAIEQLSAEQNADETRRSICYTGAELRQLEVGDGSTSSKTAGSLVTTHCRSFDVPVGKLAAGDIPITVKVVGVDRRGRRVAGWAVVPPRAPAATERLAQRIR